MDPSIWIALAAVLISALTVWAGQQRLKRVEKGEYTDSIYKKLDFMREDIRDLKDENKDMRITIKRLEADVAKCERDRYMLTKENLEMTRELQKLKAG